MKCSVLQIVTIIYVTYVQKDFLDSNFNWAFQKGNVFKICTQSTMIWTPEFLVICNFMYYIM